jgi:hypothetical protein
MDTFMRTEDIGDGATTNPSNVLGAADNKFARFHTPISGQAATVVATATSSIKGDVYCTGYRSSNNTGQYAIVWGSITGSATSLTEWYAIGYTKISSTSSGDNYVGYTGTGYPYLSVGCNTFMGGAATYNDFYLDSVKIVN